ncbi:MAG: nucleotidyltransferase domain-containing protein [Deltaproteobacteria bacterium]|nr:nucleotidyltransferase domain-containing protein [Deltaproteobacteria bacterium]MCL5673242.1 nucleotidyltransferase domain-containing protein [Deltaproteobacteria bacterium]
MKTIKTLNLKDSEINAIMELKKRVLQLYPDAEIILFGSKARGDYNKDSDIDILILLGAKVNYNVEKKIIKNISDIYSIYDDVVFETLIENKDEWLNNKLNYFIRNNINKEGISL